MGVITAGADDFQYIHVVGYLQGVVTHGSRTAGNFVNGFGFGALCGEGCKKCGILGGTGFAAHDFIHDAVRLIIGQILFVNNFYNSFFNHNVSSFLFIF